MMTRTLRNKFKINIRLLKIFKPELKIWIRKKNKPLINTEKNNKNYI